MKNAVATLHTPWNFQELADLTNPNKERYCAKRGYDFHPRFSNFDYDKYRVDPNRPMGLSNWHGGFQKIGHVLDLLKSGEYEWVFWLGCDTVITNFDIKIKDITDSNYHFIIANDCNEWNSDSFMVRSSEEGIAWMECLDNSVDKYIGHIWGEQQAMIELREPYKDIIKIVPQEDINSYEYSIYPTPQHQAGRDILGNNGRWTKGHYVVHWPGTTLAHRLQLAKNYLKDGVVGDD
jgi:hypothetical protein